MTRKEAIRQTHQENILRDLGFTSEEAEALRRISMTLHRWYEMECGIDNGCIERDETTDKPFWHNSISGRLSPIADREKGAIKRLKAIFEARNTRQLAAIPLDDLQRAQRNGGTGFTPLSYYLQTDPRGAVLYIIRPGDVPEGKDVSAYYSRGICVY